MRFIKQKSLREHYLKDTKIEKTKFLWLPITIDSETRWLEKATMIYEVRSLGDFLRGRYLQWTPVKFVNEQYLKEYNMYKITRTVIDLSSIPEEYKEHSLLKGATRQTYLEFHYSKNEPDDDFTKYLIETYPSLKRMHAFLIYIDI